VASEIEKLSLTREACISFFLFSLNLCGKHKTKEGKSPVAKQMQKNI